MSDDQTIARLTAEVASLEGELKRTQELLRPDGDYTSESLAKELCSVFVKAATRLGVGPWLDELGWAMAACGFQNGIPVEELQRALAAKYHGISKGKRTQ